MFGYSQPTITIEVPEERLARARTVAARALLNDGFSFDEAAELLDPEPTVVTIEAVSLFAELS